MVSVNVRVILKFSDLSTLHALAIIEKSKELLFTWVIPSDTYLIRNLKICINSSKSNNRKTLYANINNICLKNKFPKLNHNILFWWK